MWTILFGSIVNKTSHLGNDEIALMIGSFLSLIFVGLSIYSLIIFRLRMDIVAQANKLEGKTGKETLAIIINTLSLIVGTFLILFDLYHQNIFSAAKGGGLLAPNETVFFFSSLKVKIPSSRFITVCLGLVRRIFNPAVYFGKDPILSRSAITLVIDYANAVGKWFENSNVGDSLAKSVKGK